MKNIYFLVFCLFFTMGTSAQTFKAFYPFTGYPADSSGNHYNGTVNGATLTTDRYGAANTAYHFDGSSHIDISSWLQLKLKTYSYAMWVKADQIPASGTSFALLSLGETNKDQTVSIGNITAQGAIGFGLTCWSSDFSSSRAYSGVQPDINRWYHVVVTRATDSIILYVDGERVKATSVLGKDTTYGSTGYKAYIGMKAGTSDQLFKGSIDEVRIYGGSVMNANAVADLYSTDFKKMLVYYPLNGTTNDTSGNNLNATLNGIATLTTDRYGVVNRAYQLNGVDNNIDFSHPELKCNRYTYSVWVRQDINIPNGSTASILTIGDQNNWQGLKTCNVNGVILGFGADAWSRDNTNNTINKGVLPQAQRWYHLMLTRDGVSAKLYIDGVLFTTTAPVAGVFPGYGVAPLKAYLGMKAGNTQYLKGAVDDVRVYNYTFSAVEVQTLYNKERPAGQTDGLIVYYPFTANAGDSSGHALDATVNGATLVKDRWGDITSAYHFNGTSDYIDCTFPDLNLFKFTYAAWVKLDANPASGSSFSVLSVGDANNEQGIVVSNISSSNLGLGSDLWSTDNTTIQLNKDTLPEVDRWYHVLVTRDMYASKLYIDGVKIDSIPLNNKMPSYGATTLKGVIGMKVGNTQFFKGTIDNVRVYNYPLNSPQVKALYDSEKLIGIPKGINEQEALWNSIRVYPNPSKNSIHFLCPISLRDLKLSVYDIHGKLLFTRDQLTSDFTMDNLTAGIYFCTVEQDGSIVKTVKAIVTE